MKTIILYDSVYGNTEIIAKAIGDSLTGEVLLLRVGEVKFSAVKTCDLLIVGSPTHGGRPTPATEEFFKKIPAGFLSGVKVAAFDTRFATDEHGVGLKILMSVIRFAAPKIAKGLSRKGGVLVATPEGFIVEDKQGPLKKGELKRAAAWANVLNLRYLKS